MFIKNIFIILAALLLSACTPGGVSNQTAVTVADTYFKHIKNDEIDQAMALYSDKFFEMRGRDDWRAYLASVKKQAGELQKSEMIKLSSDTRFSGKFYFLEYRNTWSNGKTWETLTLRNLVDAKDIQLIGHKIKVKIKGK